VSLPLFEALEPEPAGIAGGAHCPRRALVPLPGRLELDYRADLVEQIRRDLEALHDPIEWSPGREFYRARIAACREWAKTLR
jgi:hypothetical protein